MEYLKNTDQENIKKAIKLLDKRVLDSQIFETFPVDNTTLNNVLSFINKKDYATFLKGRRNLNILQANELIDLFKQESEKFESYAKGQKFEVLEKYNNLSDALNNFEDVADFVNYQNNYKYYNVLIDKVKNSKIDQVYKIDVSKPLGINILSFENLRNHLRWFLD